MHNGLIAASLPAGAEVLTAEGDFASTVSPFHIRGDLRVRAVPLERIAESVGPATSMVAVSAVRTVWWVDRESPRTVKNSVSGLGLSGASGDAATRPEGAAAVGSAGAVMTS